MFRLKAKAGDKEPLMILNNGEMKRYADMAQMLVHARPYIQKYKDKIIVIKYGGNAMIDEKLKEAVMNDIVLLSFMGVKVVLVHGGGPEISDMLKKMGKETHFVNGLRYTDKETSDVVMMVLAGKVNKDLVSKIEKKSGKAIGLCGVDGNIITAKKMENGDDLGYVGEVSKVDAKLILDAIELGYIPVISTVAADENGDIYNINADTAAASIAAELKSENVILMTDTRGLLSNKDDESSLIPVVNVSEVPWYIKTGVISGGMIPKMECCVEAVRKGVGRAFIIDGRIEHSILIELLSDEGIGTMVL